MKLKGSGPNKGKLFKVKSEKVSGELNQDAFESARAVFAKIDELAASGLVSWDSLHTEAPNFPSVKGTQAHRRAAPRAPSRRVRAQSSELCKPRKHQGA